jgi:SAM-dependent methyltransferase
MNKRKFMNAKTYWEQKLLGWEKDRYSRWGSLNPLSWTVRSRFFTAAQLIIDRLPKGGTIFEIECGSGLLAERLTEICDKYTGIDISESAIRVACERINNACFIFKAGDALKIDYGPADLTVLLGVTDWLDEAGVRKMFAKIKSNNILISHTQAPSWSPYSFYRLMMDRPVSKDSYRAFNYSGERIRAMLNEAGYEFEAVTRPTLLNPGALVWATKMKV